MKKNLKKLELNKFAIAKLSNTNEIKGGGYSDDLDVCHPITQWGLACQGPPNTNEDANITL